MSRRIRLVILAVFAATFALTTPIVILTTAGYRYNWDKGRMDKTGIIKFVTKPNGAKIWLNGQLQSKTTPTSIFRLLPEDYEIRMELPGYHEWKKTLEVESGKTTFTEDVVLIRQTSPRPIIDIQWSSGAWSDDGLHLAAVREIAGTSELIVMNSDGKNERILARLTPQKYSKIDLNWSPDGKKIMFQGDLNEKPGHKEIMAYDISSAETGHHMLAGPSGNREINNVRWSTDSQKITFIADQTTYVTDVAEGSMQSIPGTLGSDDAFHTDGLFMISKRDKEKSQILEVFPDGSNVPQLLANLPSGQWEFSSATDDYIIFSNVQSAQMAAYRISDGKLFGPWPGSKSRWGHGSNRDNLLIWNDFEISIWNSETERRSVITRLSSTIGQCFWDHTGRNVMFTAGNSVLAAEIDGRDGRNVYELNRMTEIGPTFINSDKRQILFLGKAGNQKALFVQEF